MKYLITGANGYIGRSFIKTLDANDHVIAYCRKTHDLGPNVKVITNIEEISDQEQIDVVINLAGAPIDAYWTKAKKDELINSRIDTTKDVITLISRLENKPKLLLSASAIGFYGEQPGQLIETAAPKDCFTHQLCAQWENEALKASQYDTRVCLARLGVVLGKNSGFISRTYWPFFFGLGGKLGSGEQMFSWIHITDVINSFKLLINTPEASGPYNIVSPDVISNAILTKTMAKTLNRPAFFHLPTSFISCIFGEMGEELLLKGSHIVPQKLLDENFSFTHETIDSALKDIL